MMYEPYVSPLVVYLLSVVDGIRCASIAVLSIVGVILAVIALGLFIEDDISERKLKIIKWMLFPIFISALLFVFVPSSQTIIKMVIAKHVTPAAVDKVGDNVDKAIDKIIEKVINYQVKIEKARENK